jgi:hypothetical protein
MASAAARSVSAGVRSHAIVFIRVLSPPDMYAPLLGMPAPLGEMTMLFLDAAFFDDGQGVLLRR